MTVVSRVTNSGKGRKLLDQLLNPSSIALVGVSSDSEKISGRMLHILLASDYAGRIYLVNAKRSEIMGHKCFASLSDLPETPDVAMVFVPSDAVLGVIREAVDMRVPYAIVYSSGFNEAGEAGQAMAAELLRVLAGTQTRLLGPNSEGLIDVHRGIPLSFSPVVDPQRGRARFQPGGIAILSQSGGIGFAIADHAERAGLGIRSVISTGNELDLELADFIQYYAADAHVDTICMFLEGLKSPAAFVEACSLARQHGKRLMAIKIGDSDSGKLAVTAHTGKVPDGKFDYSELFQSAGVIPMTDLPDVINVIHASKRLQPVRGKRVAVVTVSGGGGIWVTDQLVAVGLDVPRLSPELTASLRQHVQKYASVLNPIDVTAQAIYDGAFAPVIRKIAAAEEIDAVVIVGTFGYDHKLLLDAEFRDALANSNKPIVVFSYTPPSPNAITALDELNTMWFTSPRQAAHALAATCGFATA